jgi:DNA excision repair protein ERCC-3
MENSRSLIVQNDRTILAEAGHPGYGWVRDRLLVFAELIKSPDLFHTYRLSRLSLWNAASIGWSADQVIALLAGHSRYPIPASVQTFIREEMSKYGKLELATEEEDMILTGDEGLIDVLGNITALQPFIRNRERNRLFIEPSLRGEVKRLLAKLGYPAKDLVGFVDGAPFAIRLRKITKSGKRFELRPYQREAVQSFLSGGLEGRSGVVVLPCGAGKTLVGLAAMSELSAYTLILAPNITSVRQWIHEIIDKTDVDTRSVGEYSAERKHICPITVTTYQMITYEKNGRYPHFETLNRQPWGFMIYDEAHLLPAPVFRLTAMMQATRRLGLTATLVREDGAEEDVFSLIGPKRYDVPWKEMERQGFVATTSCYEIAVDMAPDKRLEYISSPERQKYRIAAENPVKIEVIRALLRKHDEDHVLIIGQYIDQLKQVANVLQVPLLTGKTPEREREKLFSAFRKGKIRTLVVSKVANVAIDLPEANVAIQISGAFGSRQEEAQRLGRILRPKTGRRESYFYSIVTKDSRDQEKSLHRQLFLTEQGYQYVHLDAEDVLKV